MWTSWAERGTVEGVESISIIKQGRMRSLLSLFVTLGRPISRNATAKFFVKAGTSTISLLSASYSIRTTDKVGKGMEALDLHLVIT